MLHLKAPLLALACTLGAAVACSQSSAKSASASGPDSSAAPAADASDNKPQSTVDCTRGIRVGRRRWHSQRSRQGEQLPSWPRLVHLRHR